VGVALLVLHHEAEQRRKRGEHPDEELLEVARTAAAQGAISILPHFDALAREAGIDYWSCVSASSRAPVATALAPTYAWRERPWSPARRCASVGGVDEGSNRCSECGRDVDEFTTIAERWLY
jgi:hypothetical protein